MTRLERALAWWPAVLRYGGFACMLGSFFLYVVTATVAPPPVEVPTQYLLSFGAMMAIGEGGKAIQNLAKMPAAPPLPVSPSKED
jgi:hypothetical protein